MWSFIVTLGLINYACTVENKNKIYMSNKKKFKFRKNVKQFVGSDYKDKLNPEELAYLENFENEYYSNALGKKGSIHEKSLSPADFERAKKETYDATNSQNRDQYAISATSPNYLKFFEAEDNFIEPVAKKPSSISKTKDPQYAFNVFLDETIDEINYGDSRDLRTILIEFGIECAKLGLYLKPDKINRSIKKQKAMKETKGKKNEK